MRTLIFSYFQMPRKKLERRVRQIIFHVGNINEVIQFDSNEKIMISKEERKQKMSKIRKEINKLESKPNIEQKKISLNINICKSKQINEPKATELSNKKHDEYFKNINLDELVVDDQKNNDYNSLEKYGNPFDDYFNYFE